MDIDEFKDYVEKNSNAKDIFTAKMKEYLNSVIISGDGKVTLTQSQAESEIKKSWNQSIKKLYDSVKRNVTTKASDAHETKVEKWLNKLSELEVLDNFTEELDNMEFD
ncbi:MULTISPECIES: hypothetical protein [unclassified Lactococcus]|uniref:hypothetical protein n=1 Tax=unclassified Lactococcus TaxID=2643510 RepID=UPI0011CB39A0|nr:MULTISPECIES: hypothetical protein [unclassified Lactococcus]MQW23215.1 hypothetical protein [Lactococcus sp. dk101]TXK38114.1 hypothetical protein FVP42_06815 [Lactococcus sp. dk310]TXK49793.1 hypothetical protein FVP43_06785 [Lactococcus sp. dk322]